MNSQSELIVYFDKNFGAIGLVFILFLSIAIFKLFLVPLNSFKTIINLSYFSYVVTVFQAIIGLVLASCAYGWLVLFVHMVDSRPVTILNEQGIWVNRCGLILWRYIEAISLYPSKGLSNVEYLPLQMQKQFTNPGIGIRIKKNAFSLVKKQSSFGRKLELTYIDFFGDYYTKYFNYPHHIPLGAVSTPAEEILSFAHHYIKK